MFFSHQVETMDRYFESVCELDIMSQLDKAHFIVDEVILPPAAPPSSVSAAAAAAAALFTSSHFICGKSRRRGKS